MKPKTITLAPPLPDADAFATKVQPAASGFMLMASTAAKVGTTASGAADRDAFCKSQTPAAAGELTVDGALACTVMKCPRVVTVYSAANLSGQTYTIRGQDYEGRQVVSAITGPNNSTVRSTAVFSAVRQVHTSGAAAGAVEVGYQAIGTPSEPCKVLITASNNESGVGYTLHGLDRYGRYVNESGTLPNAAAAFSLRHYSRVIGMDLSSKTASIIQIGIGGEYESQWVPVNRYAPKTIMTIALSSSADVTYKPEWTLEDVHSTEFGPTRQLTASLSPYVHVATWLGATGATTVSNFVVIDHPVSAVRVAFKSFASGSANVRIVQERQQV